MANITGYPSHQIATKKKGYEWVLRYVKAAWNDARGLPNGYYWSSNGSASYNQKRCMLWGNNLLQDL